MGSIKSAMEEGFNAFLLEHRKTPSTRLTLVQFDTMPPSLFGSQQLALDTVYENRPVLEAPTLTLTPRGGTPLIDALCKTIDMTGDRLRRLPESERPKGVLFVVITDGEENMSHAYQKIDVKQRIAHQEGAYSWQFLFLGANQDAIGEARSYGITQDRAMTYAATLGSTRALFNNTAVKSASFTASVASGQSVSASAPLLDYCQADRTAVISEVEKP